MTQSPTSRWSPWTLHGDGRQVRPGDVVAPDERLSWPRTIGVGVQHVVAMFGATFTVPLITGFPPATTLLFSGLGTLLFLLITGNRLPSYLGSSFAFIAPVLAAKTDGGIGAALGGIVVAGVALAIVGVVVQVAGSRWIDALMPPVVTGAIVMLIGLNLAPVAWDGGGSGTGVKAQPLIAVVTLVAILLTTVLFRGFVARLSILVGVVVGWVLAALTGNLDQQAVRGLRQAAWIGFPEFHTPSFDARAVVLVIPVILVLIAENAGHVKAVAAMTGRNLDRDMGRALLGDGVATVLAGSGGGSGTTTYAENIGVMAATRVYSTAAYWVAGGTAILLGLCPKFGALILTVPAGVLGGATTALYGLIAILGARIWIENRVDFHDPINLFTAAVAVIIGAANYTLTAGDLSFNGIALGTAAALVIYHGMRLIARLRGTTPESRQSPEPEL
ncbi:MULTISPECIES: solute carrier family 23 protein [unclassified Micromonospora]|uniref:uracil-xanthine permease family protein n=1 Tax=unclassified Micromonospora TaxID=2617518 RepID=UPI00189075D5|nr:MULTISPECIES: solute carrier family 23 protein [unclassified Micromonospora]MBF5030907.1 purine/pyrimidine permease [Micromonospora sp. ANENR4]MCZ7474275.1 purine/pyrimidine permease [Micromonospora sp. WMMC273]WBC04927.1 purine/pyrimidine permease [Micromonospora sp. WMMA1976]